MFDAVNFGAKLQRHRKRLDMTQNEVAELLGVSPQAVSKWENGDCLPDCCNLKQLGGAYGISLDMLLDLDTTKDLSAVSASIEQLATEYVWAASERGGYYHEELGRDLWELSKCIYFVEVGDTVLQQQDKAKGKTRFVGPYGMKLWDDDGIACTITQVFADGFTSVSTEDAEAMAWLLTPSVFGIVRVLKGSEPLSKSQLADRVGLTEESLSPPLLQLIEREYVEMVKRPGNSAAYRLGDRRGMVVWLLLAGVKLISAKDFSVCRYVPN